MLGYPFFQNFKGVSFFVGHEPLHPVSGGDGARCVPSTRSQALRAQPVLNHIEQAAAKLAQSTPFFAMIEPPELFRWGSPRDV